MLFIKILYLVKYRRIFNKNKGFDVSWVFTTPTFSKTEKTESSTCARKTREAKSALKTKRENYFIRNSKILLEKVSGVSKPEFWFKEGFNFFNPGSL